ncbi:MAG: NCS1 family nucleobase:cation symporter-1 [Opitutaceae bacterium]
MSPGALENPDLAPVRPERRTWRTGSYAALWISMSACVPTYMLASSLVGGGMNWWEAILTIFLGNTIVLVPILLNAHAGTRYGIPFPVLCRASFGTRGANIPAMLRALVACGWFGIQSWIGGDAICRILAVFFPAFGAGPQNALGITLPQFACFMAFWGINMWVVFKGIDSIRILLNIKAPLLMALGLVFLVWAYRGAGGFGPMLSQPSAFDPGQPKAGRFMEFFVPGLTGMIGFWATLSLNIPDFSRYAASQRDQVVGQALGLPLAMAFYSFIGVAVTSATAVIFGQTIWNPLDVLIRFRSPAVLIVAMLALCIATLATNIAANVVSPANDFSHLAPRRISFRLGGLITGIIGIAMMPWKLVADPSGYIFTWLVGYSALLGPVGGIMIADYFILRRRELDVPALYDPNGRYRYSRGWSVVAIAAFGVAVLPNLPGFLAQVGWIDPARVPHPLLAVYGYAWFAGFAIAFVAYLLLRKLAPNS